MLDNDLKYAKHSAFLKEFQREVNAYIKGSQSPFMITPHLHDEYEIYYNISGARGFFIEDKYFACLPHDLFIIPKMHIHRVSVGEPDNYIRCVINIKQEMIDRLRTFLSAPHELDFLDETGGNFPIKVHLSKADHERFIMHIKEYQRLEQTDDVLLMSAKLFEILSFVRYVFYEAEHTDVPEKVPELWSEKAIYYVEHHFLDCQPADVAKALAVNESYLSRVFKNETGTSLSNYMIQRRIAGAKKLLYSGVSVKETCMQSGFNDCSNFIRTFKKFTGMSPGTLKKTVH